MSLKVIRWADNWVIEITTAQLSRFSEASVASEVERFLADAKEQGISRRELEDVLGNLASYIAEEYERRQTEEAAERHGRGD